MTSSQEYFMIVAKSLNMTQSAKELFISQQSLSYHISQLEKQYHTQLFVRKPALRLTQAGEHLLVRLEKLAKMERDIQAEMQDFSIVPQGELIVGMHPSRFNLLSPLVCPEFRRRVPGTRLKILPGTASQFEQQLLRGELDVFIGVNPHFYPNTEVQKLLHETAYVAVPRWMWQEKYGQSAEKTEQLAKREGLELHEIIDFPFVDCLVGHSQLQAYVKNYVEGVGLNWNSVISCSDPIAYLVMENHSQVSAIFPQGHILILKQINARRKPEDRLMWFPVRDIDWEDNLCMVWRKDTYVSQTLQTFIEIVQKAFQKI